MSISNEELVNKAISSANNLSASGKLNPKQADAFIDYVFDESVLAKTVRTVRFRNESMDIDKIGVGSRVAMPKAKAKGRGGRGVTTSKVTLTPVEVMVPFEIEDSFGEHSIEGETSEAHVIRMFATQTNNDLEELYIHGTTDGLVNLEEDVYPDGSSTQYVEDAYLALFNGILKQAESGNTYDHGGAAINNSMFGAMIRAMPTKYRRDKSKLRWICSTDLEQLWMERLSSRATALGDAALSQGIVHAPYGVKFMSLPKMSFYVPYAEDITFTGNDTSDSLTYAPVNSGSVVIVANSIGDTPVDAYTEDTDYAVNYSTGVITHDSGGSIGNTDTVRVSYEAYPQMVLTHVDNLILAIGRDIRIEKDRDIYATANQYAITVKVDMKYENDEAVVHGYNIGATL